ncbi:helix-turn-helix domain-containing protein [Rhodococcus qingshengii]|uniref:helix-turn-helix domain-containing protein n=1 Tax=Rhodococcus qingshengii TaxID=334542 RepID=UPI0010A689DD|nr:helix-turn-helix transcriptional regulator [Rhodococcus qingshengii]THJ69953.1 helix-turn-helix transcriptional regulator [Rhodococcus qingshengii]
MSKWSDFLRSNLNRKGWDQARLADEAGYHKSNVTGWLSGKTGSPSIETVKKTAIAFGVPIAEALIAAEYIDESDLNIERLAPDPDLLTDEQLLEQLHKRMGVKPKALTTPDQSSEVDGKQEDYVLARMEGETEEQYRRRTEVAPEDQSQGEASEWGA